MIFPVVFPIPIDCLLANSFVSPNFSLNLAGRKWGAVSKVKGIDQPHEIKCLFNLRLKMKMKTCIATYSVANRICQLYKYNGGRFVSLY